jgi:hypothetical protein
MKKSQSSAMLSNHSPHSVKAKLTSKATWAFAPIKMFGLLVSLPAA